MDVEPAGVTLWFKRRRRSWMCSVGFDATSRPPPLPDPSGGDRQDPRGAQQASAHDLSPFAPVMGAFQHVRGVRLLQREAAEQHRCPAPKICAQNHPGQLGAAKSVKPQTSGHLALRQVARAQRKGLNFPVFVGEKSAFCEPLSLSELLEYNDWQNAATSCPPVPNDLLERELFYCTHRCSRARTSRLLSEVLKSEPKL